MKKSLKIFPFVGMLIIFLSLGLLGCASGPSVIKTYNEADNRSQIAILMADNNAHLKIFACDGKSVPRTARYILLLPGRHEVWFTMYGQTLLEVYSMRNKKYLDVMAGHTYVLKSKGAGIFAVGDKWFPELTDVTNDANLHVQSIPQEGRK